MGSRHVIPCKGRIKTLTHKLRVIHTNKSLCLLTRAAVKNMCMQQTFHCDWS